MSKYLANAGKHLSFCRYLPFVLVVMVFFPVEAMAQPAPCAPSISLGDGEMLAAECGSAEVAGQQATADALYGPVGPSAGAQISQCPGIPSAFSKVHRVKNFAEFELAYGRVQPGEAIMFSAGKYRWKNEVAEQSTLPTHPFFLEKNGTKSQPIYILSERMFAAEFESSWVTMYLKGSHHVIAGFSFNSPVRDVAYVDAPDNRIACNTMRDALNVYIRTAPEGTADRTEIDNNVFSGARYQGLLISRCNPMEKSCTENSMGIRISHNTFSNKAPEEFEGSGHEAIVLGLHYHPEESIKTYNINDNNLDAIVENNLFDGWQGEEELITIKSSRNVIRNNCVKNAPNSHIVIRAGDNNVLHGNWFQNNRSGQRVSGRGNYFVFNYVSTVHESGAALRLHTANLYPQGHALQGAYQYLDASDGVYRYNVFNRAARMVEVFGRIGTRFEANPTGNVISNNSFYSGRFKGNNSSGSYVNSDNRFSESAFRQSNNWGNNEVRASSLSVTDCADSSLFSGPGGTGASIQLGADVQQASQRVSAPSWW